MAVRYTGENVAEQLHTLACSATKAHYLSTSRTVVHGRIHSVRLFGGVGLILRVWDADYDKLRRVVWRLTWEERTHAMASLAAYYGWRERGVSWNRELVAPGF